MADVQTLRDKRFKLWEDAKKFLDEHTDADGKISNEDVATYERMEKDIVALGAQIERFEKQASMDAKFNNLHAEYTPISNYSGSLSQNGGFMQNKKSMYQSTDEYHQNFLKAIRSNFTVKNDYLQTGVDSKGGYLLPTEMNNEIVTRLEQENVMRQICRVIQTESIHKIPVQATKPVAAWIREGDSITLSGETFSEVTLDAYKLACGVKISNELLADSFYDVEEHLEIEFSKALAASEEQAFIAGSGNGEPTGFLTTLSGETDAALTTASTTLSIDDLINTVYSLRREYRQNAVWLMHDGALQQIRQLKNNNLNHYWTPSTIDGEPDKLLGFSVYTSAFMPQYATGAVVAAFGDFQRYYIADRAVRSFKPLMELYALNDISAFLMIERLDGKLVDNAAIKLLTLK